MNGELASVFVGHAAPAEASVQLTHGSCEAVQVGSLPVDYTVRILGQKPGAVGTSSSPTGEQLVDSRAVENLD